MLLKYIIGDTFFNALQRNVPLQLFALRTWNFGNYFRTILARRHRLAHVYIVYINILIRLSRSSKINIETK